MKGKGGKHGASGRPKDSIGGAGRPPKGSGGKTQSGTGPSNERGCAC